MATLIQSKQIEGVVTASVIEGDFYVSGQIIATGSQSLFNSISSSGPIYGVRYDDINGTPNFEGGTGITITQVGDTITITNTGGGGGVSGSAQLISSVAQLNAYTASNDIIILGLEQFTESIQNQVDSLTAATSSYLTELPNGVISGSTYTDFSSSVESRLSTLEGRTDNTGSDSQTLSIVGDQLTIDGGNTITIPTGSSGGGTSDFNELTNVPSGLVSSSNQVLGGTDIVSGSVLRTLDGTGVLSGSKTDISSLNTFTESIDTRVTSLESFSSSLDSTFATDSELNSLSASIATTIDGIQHTQIPSGTVSGSDQVTQSLDTRYLNTSTYTTDSASFDSRISSIVSSGVPAGTVSSSLQTISHLDGTNIFSGSVIGQGNITITSGSGNIIISGSDVGSSSDVSFDGDRVISNEDLGDLFTNQVNPGTSGSIQDFLNAVFYPNSGPSISTGNQTISEYTTNGTTIVTLSGTDPEGQSITWGTGSSYTDDLVRVASNGLMTLNALAESSSFNTDSVGGGFGHLVNVKATDTFGTSTEKDIYIIVTPNESPKFRQTSVGGTIINSFSTNLNESSTNGTVVGTIYFTDVEGDSITIYSSSVDNNHFVINKYPTYVQIVQNTGSLDYEQQTSYSFSISASDEHYEAGQDLDSITSLPITINVTDNLVPVVNNQTLSSINENSSNGASVDSIAASDNETDTITFLNFNLHKLLLDDVEVTSGSYGGTSQLTDPSENPFQMNSSGVVTRKNGVYLNSDLINKYQYRVQVKDNFNASSAPSIITIPITDDTPATLSDNFSFGYIIESATTGDVIRTNTDGFTGTQADLNSNQSGTWSSSNSTILIDTNGSLSLGVDLSGSVTQSGEVISTTITFTNTFGTTTTQGVTTLVSENQAPTAVFTNQSAVFNSNQAITNTNLVSVSITDTEGDAPYNLIIGGTDASKLNAVPQNADSSSWELQASENLIGGTYNYDVVVTDSYSKSTSYNGRSFVIAQADTGSLGGDTTSYIIESAPSGESLRDASGYNSGNTSQLSVSYSPNYGSQLVQSFTSSNSAISIDSSGNLTLGLNISGSTTGSGDTISSTITYRDQYDNIGSGSLTVNVFANNAPSANFTENSSFFNTNQATGSVSLVDVTISDTESDTPYNLTIGGVNGSSLNAVPQNVNSSSWEIQPASDLSAGTYTYDVSVTDNFGKTTNYNNKTITIVAADTGTLSTNGTFYIIESAVSSNLIRTSTNGITGTQGSISVGYSPNYGSQSATSFVSSNALIDINSSTGLLSVGNNISGSGNINGDVITSTISWIDQYGNNGSDDISVNVAKNNAPSVSGTSTQNLNTNQATGSSRVLQLQLTDTEGDSIPNSSLTFTNYNSTYFTPSISSPFMRLNVNNTSVPAGVYSYTASIEDIHAFEARTHSGSFEIVQSDIGTLGGDTSIYIIESAESGDVFRDQTGFNQGNAAQLSVSYSPSHGSPVVQSYTSSNDSIVVDASGNLTLGVDLSGSVTQSGDTITSNITFRDQYNNIGSGSVTATLFGNQSPSANFTATTPYDTDNSVSGSTAGTLIVTDTENNSPFSITLAGTDGDKFDVSGSSSPFTIQPTGSLTEGSYSINITVSDTYNESVTLTNESIVVSAAALTATVYVYTLPIDGTYDNVSGITAAGSGTPPEPTISTTYGFFTSFVDSDTLGDSSITVQYGGAQTANLRGSGSGDNIDTILDTIGSLTIGGTPASERIYIMIPSGSGLTGMPTSLTQSDPGSSSTLGEYILFVSPDGTYQDSTGGLGNDIKEGNIHKLTLDTAVDGFTDWFVIGTEDKFNNANAYVRLVPSSGSVPS